MYSVWDDARLVAPGCPIRKSPDQSLLSGSPELFAASHVLHRLPAPRHPPYALCSLTTLHCRYQMRFLLSGYPYAIVKEPPQEIPLVSGLHDDQAQALPIVQPTYSGADRDRTDDLRLARAALSQLSYSPLSILRRGRLRPPPDAVGLGRVELPTSPLSGVRSSRLSYRPAQRAGPSKLDGRLRTNPQELAESPLRTARNGSS